jgi:cytosine/adenosine deaminase-related metal-dependent hydrolase
MNIIAESEHMRKFGPLFFVLLLILGMSTSLVENSRAASTDIIINEILVSANTESYGGTDWNGDGSFGKASDQFIELYNSGDEAVNLEGWSITHSSDTGAPNCKISAGTVIESGSYLPFYSSDTWMEFSFHDGDTITLTDTTGEIDQVSFPAKDSDYDIPYGLDGSGNWIKMVSGSPTPGGANDATWVGAVHDKGECDRQIDHIQDGSYILKGRLVTMNNQRDIIENGSILVKDGVIEDIWQEGEQPQGLENITVVETGGNIYPGLIDAHNHAHYNYIPLWDHDYDGWDNRGEWQALNSYKDAVSRVKNHVGSGAAADCDLAADGMKFAEVRSLAGGTTAIQGGDIGKTATFKTILARNVELYNFGRDYVQTKVSSIDADYEGNHIKSGNASGNLDGWFLHLAEGIDEESRAEFDTLVANELLVGELIIIHGTALTTAEFDQMGAVGASLVWSPLSNLLLYGGTTDVAAAKAAGVNIALAPDWAPSGSKNVLHSLKMADWWDENVLGDIFTDQEMVEMVTTNPIKATNWQGDTGSIRIGLAADLMVLEDFHSDPYRNVIEAIDPDVRLVIVGGLPVFGDEDLVSQLDGEYELVQGNGFTKVVDVTYDGVSLAHKSFADISTDIAACMAEKTSAPLENIFAYGDDRFFDVLNRSTAFQKGNRNIDLWSDYYDVEIGADGHRLNSSIPLVEEPTNDTTETEDNTTDPETNTTTLSDNNSQLVDNTTNTSTDPVIKDPVQSDDMFAELSTTETTIYVAAAAIIGLLAAVIASGLIARLTRENS